MSPREAIAALQQHVEQSIKGQGSVIRQIVIGLLANGHLLLESVPGLAKTRMVKSVAASLDAQMRRIQFTHRFLLKVLITYPAAGDERDVLRLVRGEETGSAAAAARPQQEPAKVPQAAIFAAREEIHGIHVADAIDRYIIDLVNASRTPARYDADLAKWIALGASPRGGIALDRAARANAWLEGRDHVTPDDVRAMALPTLRHRLILSYDASADGLDADAVVNKLVEVVAVPA
ncbi:ATPase [Cupriavidus basilensis OR16]|uniref:ATPase n=1 Tax=Cupriavidus basilensis OR16 TaxID=1127483 RepID=H1SH86_9BURK|nr:MoxR family ATPase [Cupriavidus basilensis]EHP38077.1 ATPase [Cupriavidus basilensis OR16]